MFRAIPLWPRTGGNGAPVTEFSAGIHDHSFDLRHRRSAVSIFRWLRARLAPAPIQQRLCRRQPRAGRRIGIVHDFGQNRGRVGRVCARQGLDVFLVCFRSLHVSQVGGLEETDQPFARPEAKLQDVLIPVAPRVVRNDCQLSIVSPERGRKTCQSMLRRTPSFR